MKLSKAATVTYRINDQLSLEVFFDNQVPSSTFGAVMSAVLRMRSESPVLLATQLPEDPADYLPALAGVDYTLVFANEWAGTTKRVEVQ